LLGGKLLPGTKAEILNYVGHRAISGIATGTACTITTAAPHGFGPNGTTDSVTISAVAGGIFIPSINNTFTMKVTGASTFTVPVNCTSIATLNLTNAVFSAIAYNNTTPTDIPKRDRIRAILHLILTSPDFTIQR